MTDQTDESTEPLFIDFIRYLHRFQDDKINDDIWKNGEGPDYRPRYRDNKDSKDRRYPLHYDKYPSSRPLRVQTTYAKKNASPNYLNRYNPYPRITVAVKQLNAGANTGTPGTNRFLNKLYCSLCGKSTHTAVDGCYAIKKIPCSPTQIPCNICKKVMKKKLFHPPTPCFNKSNQGNTFQQKNNFQKNFTGNRRQTNWQSRTVKPTGGNTTPLGPPCCKLTSTNPVQIMNSVDNPWNSSVEVNLIQSLTELYVNPLLTRQIILSDLAEIHRINSYFP